MPGSDAPVSRNVLDTETIFISYAGVSINMLALDKVRGSK